MRNAFVIVALVLMSLVGIRSASAETVLYATSGAFANSGSGFTINNASGPGGTSTIHTDGLTGSTISFTGVSNLVDTPSTAPLGTFNTTTPLTGPQIDSYNGTTFTLTIDQLSPGMASGSVVGTLTGTLRKSSSGAGGSTLDLTFGNSSITLNGVSYTPLDLGIAGATFTVQTTLQGNIAAVPVPAAAMGGLGLLGIIGLGKFWRRQVA